MSDRHPFLDAEIPAELESWAGEPFGRDVNLRSGESIHVETNGRGGLLEIPESVPASGFQGMAWTERAQPVPPPAPVEHEISNRADLLPIVAAAVERIGASSVTEISAEIGLSESRLRSVVYELHARECS
jgi:hypothetical protein